MISTGSDGSHIPSEGIALNISKGAKSLKCGDYMRRQDKSTIDPSEKKKSQAILVRIASCKSTKSVKSSRSKSMGKADYVHSGGIGFGNIHGKPENYSDVKSRLFKPTKSLL
jgi:hypothetical protein